MLHKNLNGCEESLKLYQKLKFGFQDIKAIETDFNPLDIPEHMPDKLKARLIKEFTGKRGVSLKTVHNKFDPKGKVVDFVLLDKEKKQTRREN